MEREEMAASPVVVRLPVRLRTWVDHYAGSRDMSRSQVIRLAVRKLAERETDTREAERVDRQD